MGHAYAPVGPLFTAKQQANAKNGSTIGFRTTARSS